MLYENRNIPTLKIMLVIREKEGRGCDFENH